MKTVCYGYLLFFFVLTSFAADYFITPNQRGCTFQCKGTLQDPFDNLILAIYATLSFPSVNLILLYDSAAPHYALIRELNSKGTSYLYLISDRSVFKMSSNLTIRPLYCDEDFVLSNSSLSNKCIQRGKKLTVFLKSTNFTLDFIGVARIEGIIFNAVEDIKQWNSNSTELIDCLYRRKRCCEENAMMSFIYPSKIKCAVRENITLPTYQTYLFRLDSSGSTTRTLILENSEFRNFLNPQLYALVLVGAQSFNLTFKNSIIDRVWFYLGTVFHYANSSIKNGSSITFDNFSFINYNVWDIFSSSITISEGYLFYSQNLFSGTMIVKNSSFTNAISSRRRQCKLMNYTSYSSPMDNSFNMGTSTLSSASNLINFKIWEKYHYDHESILGSSLIYFKIIDGAISINSCLFQDIIGTSGSVLRVSDVNSANNWFTIYNSTFHNNFAYDGFVNIRIGKATRPYLTGFFDCPYVELVGSTFTNSTGCPGAYGNVLLLCYWYPGGDTEGANPFEEYGSDINSNGIKEFQQRLANVRNDKVFPLIVVKNSTFQNNLLAATNSLAILGSYYTYLEGNKFLDNGGTTGKIGIYVFNELSCHQKRFPSIKLSENKNGEINFGQATAVYLYHLMKLDSKYNVYQRNWGPYEGSLNLASSLTIKRWYSYGKIQLRGDYFGDHGIIPPIFLPKLQVDGWSYYTESIITIDIYHYRILSSETFSAKISIEDTKLVNNIASYDLTNFRYNYKAIQNLISVLKLGITGLIKFLNLQEANVAGVKEFDQLYEYNYFVEVPFKSLFFLIGGEIGNNTLMTYGCLFSSFFIGLYAIDGVRITNNKIIESETWFNSQNNQMFGNIQKKSSGMFCTIQKGNFVPVSKTSLVMHSCFVNNNTAQLVNTVGSNNNSVYLINSIITGNRISSSSLFGIFDLASLFNLNNLFANNYNGFGNFYLDDPSKLANIFNVYLKNDGFYSSILFLKGSVPNTGFHESFAKVYWNTVNPASPFFSKSIIPQGGLYFINSSQISIWMNEFSQNTAYSGIVTSRNSKVSLKNCKIIDHNISGISIIGSFILSSLEISHTKLINSSIIATNQEKKGVSAGIIRLVESYAIWENLEIINGTAQNGALIIAGNCATVSINNITIENFFQVDHDKTPLLHFILSEIEINSIRFSNVTSTFQLFQSKMKLKSGLFQDIKAFRKILYLFNVDKTDLTLDKVSYISNNEFGEFPLFTGKSSNFEFIELKVRNASNGIKTIVNMNDKGNLLVSNSIFEFTQTDSDTTIFDLDSVDYIIIRECLFNFAGRIIEASSLYGKFDFVSNTILTNSHIGSISITNMQSCFVFNNYFVGSFDLPVDGKDILSESQLRLVDSNGDIILRRNVMISLLGLNGIVEINSKSVPYNLISYDNVFIFNTASQGGAICLKVTHLSNSNNIPSAKIINSIFALNRAITYQQTQGVGGALYLATLDLAVQQTEIIDSIFLRNSAEFNGGAIFFDYSSVNVSNNSIFKDNRALQLNHIGSKPSYFVYVDGSVDLNFTYVPSSKQIPNNINNIKTFYAWHNLVSGWETNQTFMFALLDMFGQLVNDDKSSLTFKAQDSKKDPYNLNQIKLKAQDGCYSLKNQKFQYQANTAINTTFTSTSLNNLNQMVYPITIELNFRSCGTGEFISYNGEYINCEKCPSGFWQMDPNTSAVSCSECDTERMICLGGDKVGPKPGYWRVNETADLMMQCPRARSCLGNYITIQEIAKNDEISLSLTGDCDERYRGNLCYNCASGYAKSSSRQDAECKRCDIDWISFCWLILLISIKIFFIAVSVKGTLQLTENFNQNNQDQINNDAILLRILLNYLQLISLVSKIPATWPNLLTEFYTGTANISSINEQNFSVECFILVASESLGLKLAFLKVLFSAIVPFLFVILAFLFWVAYFMVKNKPILFNRDFLNKVVTTIIIICYQNQTSAIQNGLNLFKCMNLYRNSQPIYFLDIDYDIECWNKEHNFWLFSLGFPILFVWVILFPGILLSILIKNKKKLHTKKISTKYSFMYSGYRQQKYYWEIFIIFRKIFILIIIILAGFYSVSLQLYLSILAIIISYLLHEKNEPYSFEALNNLESASLLSSGIVNFTGLYFHIISQGKFLDLIMTGFGFMGMLYFLLLFLKLFLAIKISKLMKNRKIMNLLNKCSIKFKWLTHSSLFQKLSTRFKTLSTKTVITENLTSGNHLITHPLTLSSLRAHKFNEATPRELYEKLNSPLGLKSSPKMSPFSDNIKNINEEPIMESSITSCGMFDNLELCNEHETPNDKIHVKARLTKNQAEKFSIISGKKKGKNMEDDRNEINCELFDNLELQNEHETPNSNNINIKSMATKNHIKKFFVTLDKDKDETVSENKKVN